MKDYRSAVEAAGIGRTPQLCQDALVEMLEELFQGKKYTGQEGRKPLKVYKQDLPVPESNDEDVDTDAAAAPYIVARMSGGTVKNDDGPQEVEFSLIICAYDEGLERDGYQDVANIKEDIVPEAVHEAVFRRVLHRAEMPIAWAMQNDDTHPYYFGACNLVCTAPAMTQTQNWRKCYEQQKNREGSGDHGPGRGGDRPGGEDRNPEAQGAGDARSIADHRCGAWPSSTRCTPGSCRKS